MGSAVWCHMTQGKRFLAMHRSAASWGAWPKKTQKNDTKRPPRFHLPDPLLAFPQPWRMEKIKTSKKKTAFNPRKARRKKTGGGREKKHRRNFIKKVVVWAFLAPFEKGTGRGKQMEDEERKNKKFVKTERCFLGKNRGREVSGVSPTSGLMCSWTRTQLRGEKCLAVLVGRKKGHMICYGQKIRKIIQKQWNRR